jgi:hypothetical protein
MPVKAACSKRTRGNLRSIWNKRRFVDVARFMEHRGVKYSIVQGVRSGVWTWNVLVGDPPMLRMGEAETEHQAEVHVRGVIDRALAVEKMLQARRRSEDKNP